MHVELTKLRVFGDKVEPAERPAPLIGHARISYWWLRNGKEDRMVRQLTLRGRDNDTDSPQAELDDCYLKEMRGDKLLFVGTEHSFKHDARGSWPQAFLLRVLTDDEKRTFERRTEGG